MSQSTMHPATQSTADVIRSVIRAACKGGTTRAAIAADLAALADALLDAGDDDGAALARAGHWQSTEEGSRIVTVGRDGAKNAATGGGHSVSVYTTKIYQACRRLRDGALTWQLAATIGGHSTSGRSISGPMIARAQSEAQQRGLDYADGITHGMLCD